MTTARSKTSRATRNRVALHPVVRPLDDDKPKLRKIRRRRCNECCHLESEHIKNAVCWDVNNSHWETVMLPICIYCGATCDDIEDEMCAKCFKAPWPAETTGSKALADVRAKWPNSIIMVNGVARFFP